MLQKHVCLLYTSLSRVYLKIFTVRTGMLSHVDHLKKKKEKEKILIPLSMPFDKHKTIIWCKSLNNNLKQTLNKDYKT